MKDTMKGTTTPQQFEEGVEELLGTYKRYLETRHPDQEASEYLLALILDIMDLMMQALCACGYGKGVEAWQRLNDNRDWFISIFGF